ncbi:MAG TPA: helix-turn-helix domain-containing protein [Methanocella sp.]|jgi:DNA-binding HxlR family transcriptional regulator
MKYKNNGKCDMNYLFQILGSRWNLIIIWHLNDGALRFTELQKRMGDVNSKTVTSHLRDLEKYHIINRVIYPEVPPRVEYSLTSHGKAFLPVFEVIREWGQSLPSPRED